MPILPLHEIQQLSPLLRGKAGSIIARIAMHIFAIDKLNTLYDRHHQLSGPDFAHSILDDLGVRYKVIGHTASLPNSPTGEYKKDSAFITISNHPYGGIDGIILADLMGHAFPNYKIMANKILERIEALAPSFITVTPTGTKRKTPTTSSILGIKQALTHLQSGGALGLFPSGAVSDFNIQRCDIRDREWQIAVIRLIAKVRVPIVPIHFLDKNSWLYYALGLIDWRIRLLRLPAELFNKRNRLIRVAIGPIIDIEEQQKYLATHSIEEFSLWLRSKVYEITDTQIYQNR